MTDDIELPHGEFHEVWWIYSPINGVHWAGLRIATFRKAVNGTLLFLIHNEVPDRTGRRVWDDVQAKEFWYKVKQIPIPTMFDIVVAAIDPVNDPPQT